MMSFRNVLFGAFVCAVSLAYTAENASVVIPDKTIELFDGKSLDGWTVFSKPDPTNASPGEVWSVKDGVIHCVGAPKGYLRTVTPYANYLLTVEWRFIKAGNTGVIVHANGEILASRNGIFTYEQLKGDIEKALAKSK